MDAIPRRQRIRGRVRSLRRKARRLAVIARHRSMQELLGLATHDLDEAVVWLAIEAPPAIEAKERWLQQIESAVQVASLRLRVADQTLVRRGPNARLIQFR